MRATSITPEVSISRRCTIPGRSAPPTPAISGNRANRPFTRVPLGRPAPGCTARPAGLSIAITSSPAWIVLKAMSGSGPTLGDRSGIVHSTASPLARRLARRGGCLFTSTKPSSTRCCTRLRLSSGNRSASTTSTRRPASLAEAVNCSVAALLIVPPPAPPTPGLLRKRRRQVRALLHPSGQQQDHKERD